MDAASVSVSRLEPGTMTVRTIVNVGDLGPNEVRWPEDEAYSMEEFVEPRARRRRPADLVAVVDDPDCDPSRAAPAHRARQGLLGRGRRSSWTASCGASSTPPGRAGSALRRRRHRLPGGADRDPRRRGVPALREESLEQLAYRDPLTGLLNRRALDEHAAQAFDVPAGPRAP